jgi:hypothetical protein
VPRSSMIGTSAQRRPLALLLTLALLLSLSLSLSASPPARADTASKILSACGRGQVPSGYTQQGYKSALKKLSTFLSEYTDCEELIHKAQLAAVGGSPRGSSGGSGGSGPGGSGSPAAPVAPPTPTEQRSLEHAHHSGAGPVRVGGQVISPGVVHANIASAFSSLPTPLLAVLGFLLVCALLTLGFFLKRHVSARRAH